MASVERWRDGWRVRWRERDGRDEAGRARWRARSRICPDKRTADEIAREVERAHARGERWVPPDELADADLREQYAAWLAALVRARRSPSTLEATAPALDALWTVLAPRGGPVRASLLTREALERVHDHLVARGNAPGTATRRVRVIEAWWRWMDTREVAGLGRAARLADLPAASAPPALLAPTWAEMDAVIRRIERPDVRRLAVFMRCTGLRVSQALAVRWEDLAGEDLTIQPGLRGSKTKQERHGRVVPLAPALLVELASWPHDHPTVVGAPHPWTARQVVIAAWRSAELAGEVRAETWRPRGHGKTRPDHAFRAGFISGLKRAGADVEAVELLVGHDLGLRGVYVARDALPLRAAVALVPLVH